MTEKIRYTCPFRNSRGEQYVIVVELDESEVADCIRNLHVAASVGRSHAVRHALNRVPVGFTVFDLDPAGIERVTLQ
jgi:hypothetical protein